LNSVSIATIAPTPCPFEESFAYSIGRSSIFSKLEVELQPAHPERDLDRRLPVRSSWISKLSTPGEQLGHLRRVVQDVPDELGRGVELLRAFDFH
jgi:hypothetical protein